MSLTRKLHVISQELKAHREARRAAGCLEILILYVTTHCNLRCGHCFYADNLNDGTQDLPPDRVRTIFQTMPFIREEIAITGGEPFLHRKLPELVRHIHDSPSSRDIQINTNGWYVDRTVGYCRDMQGWNRKRISIQISLDGLEKTHDAIRGMPGSFQKAMATASELRKLAHYSEPGFFTPVFLMIVNRDNYQDIRPLSELIRKEFGICLGLELVRGTDFSAWGIPEDIQEKSYNPPEIPLPPEAAWDSIYEEVRAMNREMDYPFRLFLSKFREQFEMLRKKRSRVRCVAPDGITPVIYSNGDVAVCEFSRPFANLAGFEDNFMALWNSPQSLAQREKLRCCSCTHACFLVPSMRRDLRSNLRLLVDL